MFQFARARPLQAGKLAAVVGLVVYAVAGFTGLLPGMELAGLLLVTFLAPVLALVVAVEGLIGGYRILTSERSVGEQFADRRAYAVVRVAEPLVAVVAAGTFVYLFETFTDGPMAGPGAIGLMFIGVGLGGPRLRRDRRPDAGRILHPLAGPHGEGIRRGEPRLIGRL